MHGHSPEIDQYSDAVSKMVSDPVAPLSYQALGRALLAYINGDPSPDLASLPPEWAQIVQEELERT
jgi:hypothetical protein